VAARLGALALLVVLGCARVPYTNRSQLILVNPKDEAALGAQAFQQVVSKSRLDPNPGTNRAVQEVGKRLAAVANRPDFQRMSQGKLAQLGGAALAIGLGDSASSSAILAAYGLGAQYGILLPYGRTQESEADHIGLLLMTQAGYDPRVAIDFWQRMEQTSRGGSPEFLSTHPSHGTRITQLRAWIPEAMRLYAATSPAPNTPLVRAGNVKR
jgi:predicted Zn-dependent protease